VRERGMKRGKERDMWAERGGKERGIGRRRWRE